MKAIVPAVAVVALVAVMGSAGYAIGNLAADKINTPEDVSKVEVIETAAEPVVVAIGKMTIPVYRARTITYVVADVSLVLKDETAANSFKDVSKANKVKNDILIEMSHLAEGDVFLAPSINTEFVKKEVMAKVGPAHPEVTTILFDQVLKQDMIRS